MSDAINALSEKAPKKFELPQSPYSVGWTTPLHVRLADQNNPLPLDCGKMIAPVDMEYEIYGELNNARDNAILILHALSGDAHAAGWLAGAEDLGRPWLKNRPGWWDDMIGPGKTFDTNKYCVICSNILGSCYGTTGPSDVDPQTGHPYGLRFPVVTVGDWVRLQERLVSFLGIRSTACCGGRFPRRPAGAGMDAGLSRPPGLGHNHCFCRPVKRPGSCL